MSTDHDSTIDTPATGRMDGGKLCRPLADNFEVTIGDRNSEDYYEKYGLPDPVLDSVVHLVVLLSDVGELFHTAAFDIDELSEVGTNTALLGL